jgi:choline monooxygenase
MGILNAPWCLPYHAFCSKNLFMTYEFEPDLARASTLPASFYQGEESLKRDLAKIFYRSWNLVGRKEQVSNPGDYFTTQIGEENLIFVCGTEGKVRGFYNVCRHRAGPLASGAGNAKMLRCQYHSWTYSLEGQLRTVPEFQGVENFEVENCKLPEVQVREWGPLIFAAVDPAMTFDVFVDTAPADLKECHLEKMKFFCTKDYPVSANWKVYVDNYLEGYHLPTVHPDLCKELDYKHYRVDTFRWYSTQDAPPKETAKLYGGGDNPGAYYYWMFPNLMFNIYQGMFQTNVVIPVNADQSIIRFDWYVREDIFDEVAKKMPELIGFSDQVQVEDADICAAVNKNLKSRSYSQGRYCVKRENGVHHFHGLIAEMLKD